MGPIAGDVGAIKKLQDQLKVCTGGWGVCVWGVGGRGGY
jgi:hypothetical protein